MVANIYEWNEKKIHILDIDGFEFKIEAELIEIEIHNNMALDHQDEDIIEQYGYEFWVQEHKENAVATLNELFEMMPELKEELKEI